MADRLHKRERKQKKVDQMLSLHMFLASFFPSMARSSSYILPLKPCKPLATLSTDSWEYKTGCLG